MAELVVLTRQKHQHLNYLPRQGYAFTRTATWAPVLLGEAAQILPEYCLAFRKRDAGYEWIALLGLKNGNAYLHPDGRLLGHYAPAVFRGYPFKCAGIGDFDPDGENQKVALCIYDSALSETSGEPLFDDNGELHNGLKGITQFVSECAQSQLMTQRAVAAIAEAGLIKPWSLMIKMPDSDEKIQVKGVYTIDEKAFQALAADKLAMLRDCGALKLIHAQLFGEKQVRQLEQRLAFQANNQADTDMPDLENLFGESDDSIQFD